MTKQATANPWDSPIGRDTYDLHTTLAKWLGERLVFLGQHSGGYPPKFEYDEWKKLLVQHGKTLLAYAETANSTDENYDAYREAKNALFFVTRNLGHLWD